MSHWLEKVVVLLKADTNDLRALARLAGGDPKTFYLGVDKKKIDFQGQDIEGMKFSDSPQQTRVPSFAELLLKAVRVWATGPPYVSEVRRLANAEHQRKTLELEIVRSELRFRNAIAHTANISHELRGPLTTVLGMANLMLSDAALTPKQRERVLAILSASTEIQGLTDDVARWDWESEPTADFTRVPPERPIRK